MNHKQKKCLRALVQSVSVAALMLVVVRGWAAPIDNDAVAPAPHIWSSLTLGHGTTRLRYSEPDPLDRVSPLDSETGSLPTTQITLRWRGQLVKALPEFALQAQANYAQGQTAYSGYLQQGNTLRPYSANTGNTLQAVRLRVGLPLSALTDRPWAQHIAPYVEQSWNQWQRNLAQYAEAFDWQTTNLGVMAVWPLAELGLPQWSRVTLEADLAIGRSLRPHIATPALRFSANLGETHSQNASLAVRYTVTPTWRLGLSYAMQRSNFGASASTLGLQYPGASCNSQDWLVSVGMRF